MIIYSSGPRITTFYSDTLSTIFLYLLSLENGTRANLLTVRSKKLHFQLPCQIFPCPDMGPVVLTS